MIPDMKFNDIPEVLSNAYELSRLCNLEVETGILNRVIINNATGANTCKN